MHTANFDNSTVTEVTLGIAGDLRQPKVFNRGQFFGSYLQ